MHFGSLKTNPFSTVLYIYIYMFFRSKSVTNVKCLTQLLLLSVQKNFTGEGSYYVETS